MDISEEIQEIQAASRGATVRASLINALTAVNRGTLPDVGPEDAGKVLVVDAEGNWVPGKGGTGLATYAIPVTLRILPTLKIPVSIHIVEDE